MVVSKNRLLLCPCHVRLPFFTKLCFGRNAKEVSILMARFLLHDLPAWWRKGSTAFLAFSFFGGLISGAAAFLFSGDSLLPMMRSSLYCSVSIVSMLLILTLPFLLSALAVSFSEPRLLLLVSYGKAFLFSFVLLGISRAFGSAGWLIRWLLAFGDCATLPLLYLYWQRHISGEVKFSNAECLVFLSLYFLAGSIDYCLIAPFLAGL